LPIITVPGATGSEFCFAPDEFEELPLSVELENLIDEEHELRTIRNNNKMQDF
jgi:hypothetical protein